MSDQTAQIEWRDDTPISVRFDDPYFSLGDGLAETRHVFLSGNQLPARFKPDFHIAELGFGTGLNMLASWQSWVDSGNQGQLNFTSFEQYPLAKTDLANALTAFPELDHLAQQFLTRYQPAALAVKLPGLNLNLITGDANQTLPGWNHKADAWFLDGFSPAKNPQLWSPQLMQGVASHTTTTGTFATYSAAGHVRRALIDAGFTVARSPGYGRKRHMSTGQRAP
jgi:tRNA U34 5-methylaminomethyl-2-thiouridine-forming methyltransferase MnmC